MLARRQKNSPNLINLQVESTTDGKTPRVDEDVAISQQSKVLSVAERSSRSQSTRRQKPYYSLIAPPQNPKHTIGAKRAENVRRLFERREDRLKRLNARSSPKKSRIEQDQKDPETVNKTLEEAEKMYRRHLQLETESSTSTINRFKAETYRPKSLGGVSSPRGKVVRINSQTDAADGSYFQQDINVQSDVNSLVSSEEIFQNTTVTKPFKSALKSVASAEVDYLVSNIDGAQTARTAGTARTADR